MNTAPATDSLDGVLERIIFFNEENNYCIAELRAGDTKDKTTITGILPGIQCGETLRLKGTWTRHPTHGPQFKIASFESALPATVYGIRRYLGSGLVKGVSKGLAERIVEKFGEATLAVISNESARLQEVDGIGKQRARAIKEAWEEQSCLREVMIFLQTYGVSVSQCSRIVKQFGMDAIRVLKNEPFRVARELHGIGFKTADKIAINMGMANDSPQRIDAGIEFALQELQDDGHTAYPAPDLVDKSAEMLQADHEVIRAGLARLIESKSLRQSPGPDGGAFVQLPYNQIAEERIASSVGRLIAGGSCLPPIKIEAAITWAQEQSKFEYADQQKDAIRQALQSKVFVITGGPGTGKTTILRAVVSILKAKKVRVVLAAPTGRAAQRLSETTGGYAQTIHRLLKFDPSKGGFVHNESKPLSADVVIADEASMLDARLAASLLQSIPTRSHLILVGDVDQLPSVGAGDVLKSLITSGRCPVSRLDVVFRQGKHSGIVFFAHAINRGEPAMPQPVNQAADLDPSKDLQFLISNDQDDCARKILDTLKLYVRDTLGRDPVKDAQTLAPMNRGLAGVENLNRVLQEGLNLSHEAMPFGTLRFKVGDKVIQTRNNYDKGIFNGDMGLITSLDGANGQIAVDFDGDRQVYDKSEMIDLQLAYAVSIHKSQGSEYPVVLIPILKAHFMMLQRNLLYTAITRGKKKVIIVGDPAAYAMAAKNSDSKSRCTMLKTFLG